MVVIVGAWANAIQASDTVTRVRRVRKRYNFMGSLLGTATEAAKIRKQPAEMTDLQSFTGPLLLSG
jgi:hypothetical protein